MRVPFILVAPLLLAACEPTQSIQQLSGSVLASECHGSPYRAELDTAEPADMSAQVSVDGQDILVSLLDAVANCCPSPDVDVSQDGAVLSVDFDDVTNEDEVCDCECITDFDAELPNVATGSYTVEVYYRGDLVDSTEIEIE